MRKLQDHDSLASSRPEGPSDTNIFHMQEWSCQTSRARSKFINVWPWKEVRPSSIKRVYFPRVFLIYGPKRSCMVACRTSGFYVISNSQGRELTCRFWVQKVRAPGSGWDYVMGNVPSFLNWQLEAFSLSLTCGDILFLLFSRASGTHICPGTRPDLYLAQNSQVVRWRVKAGRFQLECITPAAAPSWCKIYLIYVSGTCSTARSSLLDRLQISSEVWRVKSGCKYTVKERRVVV